MFGDERDRINVDESKDKFIALELILDPIKVHELQKKASKILVIDR